MGEVSVGYFVSWKTMVIDQVLYWIVWQYSITFYIRLTENLTQTCLTFWTKKWFNDVLIRHFTFQASRKKTIIIHYELKKTQQGVIFGRNLCFFASLWAVRFNSLLLVYWQQVSFNNNIIGNWPEQLWLYIWEARNTYKNKEMRVLIYMRFLYF